MELTDKELSDFEKRHKRLGILPTGAELVRVHVSASRGASREDVLDELEKMDVAISEGKSRPLNFGDRKWK